MRSFYWLTQDFRLSRKISSIQVIDYGLSSHHFSTRFTFDWRAGDWVERPSQSQKEILDTRLQTEGREVCEDLALYSSAFSNDMTGHKSHSVLVLKNSLYKRMKPAKLRRFLVKMHLKMQRVFCLRNAQFKKPGILGLLFHNKLLLKHPLKVLIRVPDKIFSLWGRQERGQGHVHGHYWATFWTGSEENTGSSFLSNNVECSRTGTFNIVKQLVKRRGSHCLVVPWSVQQVEAQTALRWAPPCSSLRMCRHHWRILALRIAFAHHKGCGHLGRDYRHMLSWIVDCWTLMNTFYFR